MTQPTATFYRPRTEVTGEVIKDINRFCSHVFEGGHRCASPALRSQTLCYHHQPERLNLPSRNARRAEERHHRRTFPVPRPTTQAELQQTLAIILHALAADRIAPRRAGRLLAALEHIRPTFHPPSKSANINKHTTLLSQSRGPK